MSVLLKVPMYLEHVDEVDVVPVEELVDEVDQFLLVALVGLQP